MLTSAGMHEQLSACKMILQCDSLVGSNIKRAALAMILKGGQP